jgi:hypothetical protein
MTSHRARKLALIYHAIELGLAVVGLSWAFYQIRRPRFVETRPR